MAKALWDHDSPNRYVPAPGRRRGLSLIINRATLLTSVLTISFAGCGLSEPDVPRVLYYDPPEGRIQGDPNRVFIDHQYIVKLRPDGYDLSQRERYTGDFVFYRNHAWNPDDEVIYVYKNNYKPSEHWLMSITVPGGDLEAVSRLPELKKHSTSGYSPMFAFDSRSRKLATVDAQQRPCGGAFKNIWYVYDVDGDDWSTHELNNYRFTTLDFDKSTGNFVGVGNSFEKGGLVVSLDATGNVLSETKSDLCAELQPRQFGYEQQYFHSQLVDGTVFIYRHLYYGKYAEGERFWERQLYTVDVATGAVERR